MASKWNQGAESIAQAEHVSPEKTGDTVAAKRVVVYSTLDGVAWSRSGTPMTPRIDDTSTANTIYIGKAAPGSETSNPVWQIKKLDISSGVIGSWADGNSLFDNIWDNRATTITYL